MEFWYEFEKVIIVIVSVTLAYVEFHQAIILKGSWIKIGMGFIGVYWAIYYSYSLYRTYFDLRPTASTKYIYFQDPDGNKTQKTAAFYTDGKDGIIQYTTIAGDIDQVGTWQVQGYVETSLGKFFTEKSSFKVYSNISTTG